MFEGELLPERQLSIEFQIRQTMQNNINKTQVNVVKCEDAPDMWVLAFFGTFETKPDKNGNQFHHLKLKYPKSNYKPIYLPRPEYMSPKENKAWKKKNLYKLIFPAEDFNIETEEVERNPISKIKQFMTWVVQ